MSNSILFPHGVTAAAYVHRGVPLQNLPQLQAGCGVANSAAEAIRDSDVILTVLSDAAAIQSTILEGAARHELSGKVVLQMGTIGPGESQEIAGQVGEAGGVYVEAPVLGSQPEAEKGTLLVMIGCKGRAEDSPAWPVTKALGKEPLQIGEV
jgi:3-hydroxyisobutyrate dehydrogenase